MKKNNIWILAVLVVFLFLSSTAFGLDLEVEEKLKDFTQENIIKENINLKDPFFQQKETEKQKEIIEEETEKEKNLDSIDLEDNSKAPKNRDITNLISQFKEKLVLKINGVLETADSRTALLVNYQNQNEVLEIGDTIDGYKLTSYNKGKAIFFKNGNRYTINY